jgi:ketosteroid isomerase-like protein
MAGRKSEAVYEKIFNGNAAVKVEFYDYTIHEYGDVFYAVGRERGRLTTDESELTLAIRTTRVFKRIDGRWRQTHHHCSFDDPKLLQSYQAAVLAQSGCQHDAANDGTPRRKRS